MKIAMLISGGVDSSVSLRLLRDAGHDITAFYLKIWLEDEFAFLGNCPWEEDLRYVRAVCEQVGVPLEVVSFQKEYWARVVSYVLAEVKEGRTPNPDVLCNSRVKFGAFYDRFGRKFDAVMTGHYAQVEQRNRQTLLSRAPDPVKDQTYFLSQLSQEQVAKVVFPIGHLHKYQVRALAQEYGLPTAARRDSQGICFLGKIAFDEFLCAHLGVRRGDIIEHETGKKLGEHEGFWYYTIGQRRGIGLSGGPWYVVTKDPLTNTITVSNVWRTPDMIRDTFTVTGLNWIAGRLPKARRLRVKLRHGARDWDCRLRFSDAGTRVRVTLAEGDPGIAPGQFAVFYEGEYCLGGGVIE